MHASYFNPKAQILIMFFVVVVLFRYFSFV
jgi:hypothetical protein